MDSSGHGLSSYNVALPVETVQNAVFDIFDRDGNGVVDLMEVLCQGLVVIKLASGAG